MHKNFWRLKNRYLKCTIRYKDFYYSGYVMIVGISVNGEGIFAHLTFEP